MNQGWFIHIRVSLAEVLFLFQGPTQDNVFHLVLTFCWTLLYCEMVFFFFQQKVSLFLNTLAVLRGIGWCFVDRGSVGLCCDWTGSMGFGERDREEKGSSDWKSFWDCSIVEEYFKKMVRVIESEASCRSGCGLSCCSVSHILYLMLDFWPSFLLIHTLGAAMWETRMGFLVSGFHLTHPAWDVAGILGVSQKKECLSFSASQADENK